MGVFNVSSVNEGFDFTPSELDTVNADNIMMAENFAEKAIMDSADYIQEHSDLVRLMAGQEISITESGQEVVYEAATLEGLGEKFKALIKKAIEKIKSLISKVVAVFTSWINSDKDFINKYSKTFTTNWVKLKKLKIKAYKYHADIKAGKLSVVYPDDCHKTITQAVYARYSLPSITTSSSAAEAKAFVEAVNKIDTEQKNDYIRGLVLQTIDGKLPADASSKELSDELYEYWRTGDSAKDTMDKSDLEANGYSAANIISTLQNNEKIVNETKKGFLKLEKALRKWEKENVDKPLKQVTKFESGASQEENEVRTGLAAFFTLASANCSTATEAIHSATGIFLQLCKEYSRTCKSIATKVVAMGEKRLAQEESYDFGNDDDGYNTSYMNAVVIK
ncbi:MAG: hypothetical protein IJ880_09590 [Bacilli bacterium]|nr:hypothetical protein [Bacilli bacterium]